MPKQRPVDAAYLERAALFHLERYSSSAENLRRVLARKALRRLGPAVDGFRLPPEIETEIAALVDRLVAEGWLDDRRYAEAQRYSMRLQGRSARMIRAKLAAKGVAAADIEAVMADDPDDDADPDMAGARRADIIAALRLARRRRIGPFRAEAPQEVGEPDSHARQKEMARLARAGFAFDICREIIAMSRDDAEDRLAAEAL